MKRKLSEVSSPYGAPMGRRAVLPDDCTTACKFHLQKLRWVSGDYDEGGAYWGNGGKTSIYWAWGDVDEIVAEYFVRAKSRTEAKKEVQKKFPNAKFFN